jgi:acetyl-CoA carboxylase carboxyl transferase subunit alpha
LASRLVTLIDTPGAFPGLEAEERGQGEAIARNLLEMSILKVPVICVVIGEGASGGALGIGIGDKVMMLDNSWYSVISPENCSTILFKTWEHKERAAEMLKLTSTEMLKNKLIDGVIKEPLGGAHQDPVAMAATLKKQLLKDLKILGERNIDELVAERIEKFCNMGVVVGGLRTCQTKDKRHQIQKKAAMSRFFLFNSILCERSAVNPSVRRSGV